MGRVDVCVDCFCRDAAEGVLHADALGPGREALFREHPEIIFFRLLKRHVSQVGKSHCSISLLPVDFNF